MTMSVHNHWKLFSLSCYHKVGCPDLQLGSLFLEPRRRGAQQIWGLDWSLIVSSAADRAGDGTHGSRTVRYPAIR